MFKFIATLILGFATCIVILAYRFLTQSEDEWNGFINEIDRIRARR